MKKKNLKSFRKLIRFFVECNKLFNFKYKFCFEKYIIYYSHNTIYGCVYRHINCNKLDLGIVISLYGTYDVIENPNWKINYISKFIEIITILKQDGNRDAKIILDKLYQDKY